MRSWHVQGQLHRLVYFETEQVLCVPQRYIKCRNKHSFSSSIQEQRAIIWYKRGKNKGKLCGCSLSFSLHKNHHNASCRSVRQMADDFNKRIRDVITGGGGPLLRITGHFYWRFSYFSCRLNTLEGAGVAKSRVLLSHVGE